MSCTFHAVKEKEKREGGEMEQEGRDDDRDREMRGGKGEEVAEDGEWRGGRTLEGKQEMVKHCICKVVKRKRERGRGRETEKRERGD